ncbi:uncharacterized protein EDB91DRAFT_1249371 [Suillus paluster]|uniref:uncharacterized protein n=1 Tax=Suillus paluster TaxID=48578 RepID=UPI001B884E7F|nr:uncharacterized protein EDB91DRAFT_1249371 [Suillus paluster]KAG1738074.1 hypothetical protein EDB91DRAFT_1249371 [Suillus paluster]
MAPPIKYKTHTAKLQAERAKHRRYYKKCRDAILAKRRQLRKDRNTHDDDNNHSDDDDKPMQLCKDRNTCDDDNNHSDDNNKPIHTLSDCIAVVKLAKDDFMQHIKSPQTFIIGVLAKYTKSIPDTPISLTGPVEGKMVFCNYVELMTSGAQQINDGDSGLAEAHSQGELLYQNYKDQ